MTMTTTTIDDRHHRRGDLVSGGASTIIRGPLLLPAARTDPSDKTERFLVLPTAPSSRRESSLLAPHNEKTDWIQWRVHEAGCRATPRSGRHALPAAPAKTDGWNPVGRMEKTHLASGVRLPRCYSAAGGSRSIQNPAQAGASSDSWMAKKWTPFTAALASCAGARAVGGLSADPRAPRSPREPRGRGVRAVHSFASCVVCGVILYAAYCQRCETPVSSSTLPDRVSADSAASSRPVGSVRRWAQPLDAPPVMRTPRAPQRARENAHCARQAGSGPDPARRWSIPPARRRGG